MTPTELRTLARELRPWNADNKKARAEYATHPIISTAICDLCGHISKDRFCRACREAAIE